MTKASGEAVNDPQATVADLQLRLDESIAQHAATAEVMQLINASPGDVGAVFDAILDRAMRFCDAGAGGLWLVDGDLARAGAWRNLPDVWVEFLTRGPFPQAEAFGPDIKARSAVHVIDLAATESYRRRNPMTVAGVDLGGIRTYLVVPLRDGDGLVGVLSLYRKEVRPFDDRQVALVKTFAAQAEIAMKNARLIDEVQAKTRDLEAALQQQTATAEVLHATSSSPGELGPVFRTVLERATHLCNARFGTLFRFDGNAFHFAADVGTPEAMAKFVRQPGPFQGAAGGMIDRINKTRQVQHSVDYAAEPVPGVAARLGGARSTLGVPILRDDVLVGAIVIYRQEVRPFSDREIGLVRGFGAQAAIAIENARLFNETRDALERQTATSYILRIISQSPTNVAPVFDAIAERARALCGALLGATTRFDGELLHLVGYHGVSPQAEAVMRASFPRKPDVSSINGRCILAKGPVQIADVETDPHYQLTAQAKAAEYRSLVAVPMLQGGDVIGVIAVTRKEPGEFPAKWIELLQTFADQAVIAIENVRLFDEVQQRTGELTKSLDDLRTAQDRLVQTEKLASLGQLTAGIAHEIKNPLNFVNNFAALSTELTDELNEILAPAPLDQRMRGDVDELTGMLKSNLEKVVQHGKRADSIVKNMLLHSRESSSERRSQDLNALVSESLNLAYHGARAERSDFNITLRQDLDPDAGAADVYPQELTRALLNLISNGFYAATRRKADGDAFEPTLTAATRMTGDAVEIRIRDNGTGIPAEIREKIFNPFFTTKPTGEGTGLGLSMTHDIIVKQHGGRIDIETEPGVFTEFIVTLPRKTPGSR